MGDDIQSSEQRGNGVSDPAQSEPETTTFDESIPMFLGLTREAPCEDGPESDVFGIFRGTVPVSMQNISVENYMSTGNDEVVHPYPLPVPRTRTVPEPEPTTGALATMPTFQHKFPNGQNVSAKIHPNGGGVVCEESEIGGDVYISKASTVFKSKVEHGFISRSSIEECEIRTSHVIESTLKMCKVTESCCNKLEAYDSKLQACTLTGSVSDSTLNNTFLTGAEVERCTMDFCRLQGSYKESVLKSCVIIGTVTNCELNNSEITRALLKGVKGHIADTGRTKRVQYFIVDNADVSQKMHITYRANQSFTVELTLTAREFRTQVRGYMERVGALKFNEEARKREIDWLCSNYKIFRKEESTVEESVSS